MATIHVGTQFRIMLGDVDISDMVQSLSVHAQVGDVARTELTLICVPSVEGHVINLRPGAALATPALESAFRAITLREDR